MGTRPGFKVGEAFSLPLLVTPEAMARFAELSGDDNPIHSDEAYARRLDFKGRVVYGGLLVAAVSKLLGTVVPGHGAVWHSLALKFHAALYVGQPAELVGTVAYSNPDMRVLQLKVAVRRSGELIADGQVQAGFPPA